MEAQRLLTVSTLDKSTNGQDVIGVLHYHRAHLPVASTATITSYYRLRPGNINNMSISLHALEAEITRLE